MAKSATRASTMKGNQNGTKLKSPDVRQEAYKQYCAHIASGYPKEAFCFEHPELDVTWETLDKYIEDNPSEFPPSLMKKARAKRYSTLFGEGMKLMKGGYPGGSPVVWQTIMRNIFKAEKWDVKDLEESNVPSQTVKVMLAEVKSLKEE